MKLFLYNSVLFLSLLFLFPKILFQYFFRGKYRESLFLRFRKRGFTTEKKPVIWLHAVSVGETKALATLVPLIRGSYPEAFILVSTVTETGQKQAKQVITQADVFCYLPLDFSWIIRSFVQTLKPDLLILVEGDYWLNILQEVKKQGGKVVVVNAKLSEASLKRYLFFKSFSQLCFSQVDHFCLQGESHLERFLKLGIPPEKMTVTGNLKFDIPFAELSVGKCDHLREALGFKSEDLVLTLGSTHEGEEKALLEELKPLWKKLPSLKTLLVPRHPERFAKVEKLLEAKGLSYGTYFHPNEKASIHLINQMGILPLCYRISDLAIVGGSFVEGIGGHDIFEPAKMGIPVLFGPNMYKQVDLVQLVSQSGAGKQLNTEELSSFIEKLLLNPDLKIKMGEKGKRLAQKSMGSAFRTWNEIQSFVRS